MRTVLRFWSLLRRWDLPRPQMPRRSIGRRSMKRWDGAATVTGDVHRYGFPRTDLQVTLDGVTIRPALALGGWVAFKPAHGGAMVMGDLVLLETEINPVMTKLIENGLEITAIHNHVLRGSPATFYMHIGGHGDPVKLATAIRTALAESKTPLTPPAPPAPQPAIDLDTAQLDQIIGVKGQANGGVYQFGVPRRDPISENGMQIAPAGRWGWRPRSTSSRPAAARPRSPATSCSTGDEVNPVIKALRANGIEVTAIHSHMLTEQPRLIFMHFWANDDALKLARGLARRARQDGEQDELSLARQDDVGSRSDGPIILGAAKRGGERGPCGRNG